jgi:sodium/proline symporter
MTLAMIIILVFGTAQAGGISAVAENAASLPGYLSMTHAYDVSTASATPYPVLTIASLLAWGLGYFGMPHILLRFMAIEDDEKVKLSRRVASIWVVISMAVAIIIGIVGLAMSRAGAIADLDGSQSETIIVHIAQLLSRYGFFAAILAGIVLSGILASTMSTADSQLLAASSSISNDLMSKFFHIKASETTRLVVSRISLIIIAIIGVVLAWDPNASVFRIVSFAWAGFGAAFGPVMLLALFWKRSNKAGAIAGMLAGGIMVFAWKFGISQLGGAFAIYELLPSFLVGLLTDIIVSLLTPAPDQKIVETFNSIK